MPRKKKKTAKSNNGPLLVGDRAYWEDVLNELIELKTLMDEAEQEGLRRASDEELLDTHFLTVPQVDELLRSAFTEKGFTAYSSVPQFGQEAILTFMVQDPSGRTEDGSLAFVRSLLKETLKHTNWRSKRLQYRLGIITGSLRGYETVHEIRALFGAEEE